MDISARDLASGYSNWNDRLRFTRANGTRSMSEYRLNVTIKACGVAAILFGIATVVSGGNAILGLHGIPESREKIVPFVLYFNFLAGFAYIITGIGLILRSRWAPAFAVAVAVATVIVFAGFGVWIFRGGAYEMRTLIAMSVRTAFWCIVSIAALVARNACSTSSVVETDLRSNNSDYAGKEMPHQKQRQ